MRHTATNYAYSPSILKNPTEISDTSFQSHTYLKNSKTLLFTQGIIMDAPQNFTFERRPFEIINVKESSFIFDGMGDEDSFITLECKSAHSDLDLIFSGETKKHPILDIDLVKRTLISRVIPDRVAVAGDLVHMSYFKQVGPSLLSQALSLFGRRTAKSSPPPKLEFCNMERPAFNALFKATKIIPSMK